ncbi:serine/threonine protein kinase, partial [bacterium]
MPPPVLASPAAYKDPLLGATLEGRFVIDAYLARGGMGRIYRGRQLPLGRVCAVKVLHPALQDDQRLDFHQRFFLEASTAAKLTHPNTVTIFDYGTTKDGLYYMVMEYLDGRTLRVAITKESPFSEERTLHVARQICRSLREAHGIGVIHRDLKPANIFLLEHGDETDVVKVLDFGLVKNMTSGGDEPQTATGVCMGSPKYMAPEQITGAPVDGRTDVYALGVLMYEMLTGHVPFDRGNGMSTIMAHVNDEVPSLRQARAHAGLDLSAELEHVVMRCLAKEREQRFGSMDEVLQALRFTGRV